MTGFPAERTQTDGRQREYSDAAQIDCSNLPDLARQEFKADADTNTILKKYGVSPGPYGPTNGEWDFQIDLQTALESVEGMRLAHMSLPEQLKLKYPDWTAMINAAMNGDLRKELDAIKKSADDAEREAALQTALALDEAREKAALARRKQAAADRVTLDSGG